MLDLTDKVVLITGLGQTAPFPETEEKGSWGIGAALATLFARRGALIFGGNRSLSSAERTKARIDSESISNNNNNNNETNKNRSVCDVMVADLTDAASVKALVDACMAKHGRIDILINNVGRSEPGCPATMAEDVWDAQVDINLKSVYLTCHHVLPIMERQATGGAIINVSSIAGLRYIGKPQVAYNATKAAIIQFTKATAVIYAAKGVRLNTVVPGLIYTPYTKALAKRFTGESMLEEEYMRIRDEQVPMKMMGDAWDVANAALFLASDEARYVTGQEIVVDGGITGSTGRT